MNSALAVKVRGTVQGVGFRLYVYRLASANTLVGWVLNAEDGVEMHLEGAEDALRMFVANLQTLPPPAATIASIETKTVMPAGFTEFTIRETPPAVQPSTRISPDLAVCDACLEELFNPADLRFHYPYINCTDCGPRYSVITGLPYDRSATTMERWHLDAACASQFHNPDDRRFHAQPLACTDCGPQYYLNAGGKIDYPPVESIRQAVQLLNEGRILAVKGIGGYHLACDAKNSATVLALRERKFRKDKPFALMAKDIDTARSVVRLSSGSEKLLKSNARPIVIAPALITPDGIAPGNNEMGVMLPYAPLHYLLFAAGAPELLVMTSANRSDEPIAYEDDDAVERLSGIADAFFIGQRPIARRMDDSVVRDGAFGPAILRRSRGYAPGAVATLPIDRPVLALGADLKNAITLVVGGQAFVSQHIGDLAHYQSFCAFRETIDDLVSMYKIPWESLLLVHDNHPQYISTNHASTLPVDDIWPVQHHRAHIASVLAERGAWEERVLGVSFDGTGYGDDGATWGGEIFVGSMKGGFDRVAHLRPVLTAGGDAASHAPVQAAAGFLAQLDALPDMAEPPFNFPDRYRQSLRLIDRNIRTFPSTSMGRLFDTAAALLGFTGETTFEGQAAIWLECLARSAGSVESYTFPFVDDELDFRPLLYGIVEDRKRGRDLSEIARAFQRGIAQGVCDAVEILCEKEHISTAVFSGGVFQNEMLLEDMKTLLGKEHIELWTNHLVPTNDGGISLGQAALAVFRNA